MKIKENVSLAAYKRGYEIIKEKGCAVSIISIGNSFFSKERIEGLILFWNKIFSKVEILIADSISIHTYKAKGYDEKEARKKTRLAGNRTRNHFLRVIQKRTQQGLSNHFHLIDWKNEVEHHTEYEKQLSFIYNLYKNNQAFKDDAIKTTKAVLENNVKNITMDKIEEGVHYLLEELAFLLASLTIFNLEKVVYIYHREWPILVNLVDGKYDGKIRDKIGFAQIDVS